MSPSTSANTVPKDTEDWFTMVSSRLRLLERHRHTPNLDDSLTKTSTLAEVIASSSTGFSIQSVEAITDGIWAQIYVIIQKTGSDLASNANGNITNVGMGYVLPQWYPAITTGLFSSGSGQIVHGYLDSNGQLVVSAMLPSIAWTISPVTNISFAATYLLKSTLQV